MYSHEKDDSWCFWQVLIAQEEKSDQGIYVNYLKKADTWIATCSPTWRGFTSNQWNRGKTFVKLVKKEKLEFYVGVPGITEPVPLVIFFRALGVCSDKDLLERVCYDLTDTPLRDLLYPSIQDADETLVTFLNKLQKGANSTTSMHFKSLRHQIVSLSFIGTKLRNKDVHLSPMEAGRKLIEQMFAHMGGGESTKSYMLGYMVNQLSSAYMGRRMEEDKDNFKNKRLDLTGQLLSHQFRKAMAHLQHDIKKRVQSYLVKDNVQQLGPLKTFVSEAVLTKHLQCAFTLGNWHTNEGLKSSGVVGVLKRMNPMATVSHLRQVRLNLPSPMKPTDAARHP